MFEVQAGTGMNVFSMQMGTKEAMQEEEHGTNAPSGTQPAILQATAAC
jgi:hypothetical protein